MEENETCHELDNLMEGVDLEQARYPLGNQSFEKIISDGKYYVDKTALIYRMTHAYNYVFLSRPRRFGKSLLCSTLASYFRGEKDLFRGLAMERLEKEWKRYPVIHLSLASVKETNKKEIDEIISNRLKSIEKEFGLCRESNGHGERLYNLIVNCYEKYEERVVVILDEYDAPLLNVLHEPDKLKEVRQTMRTLFSPLKDCDKYLKFLFITGITKFSQLSIFSEINNLKPISMLPEYSTLCGFTQKELESTFVDGINNLAEKKDLTEQMETLQADYANLSSDYDSINSQLDTSRAEVAELIERIKKTEATNRAKMRQYEKELGTLRSIMRNYIVKIDSLNTLNHRLTADAAAARKEAAESKRANQQLSQQVEDLTGQVAAGSVLKARGLSIAAYNSSDKVTDRSSRVTRLLTTLSLVENALAPKGPVRVYIRVKDPEGVILTNSVNTSFNYGGETMVASASREVDYQGKEVELSIYLNDIPAYTKGIYTVEAYTEQSRLGTAELLLR